MSSTALSDHPVLQVEPPKLSEVIARERIALQTSANALNEIIIANKILVNGMKDTSERAVVEGTSRDPLLCAKGMNFHEALHLQQRWKFEQAELIHKSRDLATRHGILTKNLENDLKELGGSGSGARFANGALELLQVSREWEKASALLRERSQGLRAFPELLEQKFLREQGFEFGGSPSREIRTVQRELNAARGFLGIRGFFHRAEVGIVTARLSHLNEIEATRQGILRDPCFSHTEESISHAPTNGDIPVFDHLAEALIERLTSLRTIIKEHDSSPIRENIDRSQSEKDEKNRGRAPYSVIADIVFHAAAIELTKDNSHEGSAYCTGLEKFIREHLISESKSSDSWKVREAHSNLGSREAVALSRVCGSSSIDAVGATAACLHWISIGRELQEVEKAVAVLGELMGMSSAKEFEHLADRPWDALQDTPVGLHNGWLVLNALRDVQVELENRAPSQGDDFELWCTLLHSPELESLGQIGFDHREGEEAVITRALTTHAKEHLAKTVLETLLISQEHEDKTVRLGYRLSRIRDSESLPFEILNAFREPGYSGENPFISGSQEQPSAVVSRVQSLSEVEVSAVVAAAPLALRHSLDILREHGQEAVQYSVADRNGQWSRNPINELLERHIERLAHHYLKHGTSREQQFVVAVLKRVQQKLEPETLTTISDALIRSQSSGGFAELVRFVCARGSSSFANEISPSMSAAALSVLNAAALSGWEKGRFAEQLFFGLPVELQASQHVAESVALLFRQKPEVVMGAGACLKKLKELRIIDDKGLLPPPGGAPIPQSVKKIDLSNLLRLAAVPGFVESVERACFSPERTSSEAIALGRLIVDVVLPESVSLGLRQEDFRSFCLILVEVAEFRNFRAIFGSQNVRSERDTYDSFLGVGRVLLKAAPHEGLLEGCHKSLLQKPEETFYALLALSRQEGVSVVSFLDPTIFSLLTQLFPRHKDRTALVSDGVRTLEAAKWFSPERLPILVEMIPLFLKEGASSEDAWSAHNANLQGGGAPFLNEPGLSIKEEMQALLEFQRHFPGLHAPVLYQAFRAIGRPEREQDLKRLGLKHTDTRVIYELKSRVAEMRNKILTSEGPIDLKHEIDQELLCALIGYPRGFSDLASPIRLFNQAYDRGQHIPVDSRLTDQTFFVDSIDIERVQAFRFSEPTHVRYELFHRELRAIKGTSLKSVLLSEQAVVRELLEEERAKLQGVLRTSGVLSSGEQRGRESELKRVEDILTRIEESASLKGFITALCDYKSKENAIATPSLRRLALRMALDELSDEDSLFAALEGAPTKAGLEALVALVNTNLKNEVLAKEPFNTLTEKQRMSIRLAVGTASFKEDFKRLDQIDSAGKEMILVHPTRGILGELSGYNCSACWTQERGIMARYSNVTALMYIRNPDDEVRRKIVGACLLLKVKATNGEDVLVIRGINPTQNFITNLKPESFFERFVDDAVVPMARSLGTSLIVIPNDGISGGAKTNRPTLGMYINDRYGLNPVVPLDPLGPTTTFNGYPIHTQCVLVRKLA
jgi:hypothetical protein